MLSPKNSFSFMYMSKSLRLKNGSSFTCNGTRSGVLEDIAEARL